MRRYIINRTPGGQKTRTEEGGEKTNRTRYVPYMFRRSIYHHRKAHRGKHGQQAEAATINQWWRRIKLKEACGTARQDAARHGLHCRFRQPLTRKVHTHVASYLAVTLNSARTETRPKKQKTNKLAVSWYLSRRNHDFPFHCSSLPLGCTSKSKKTTIYSSHRRNKEQPNPREPNQTRPNKMTCRRHRRAPLPSRTHELKREEEHV